MIFLVENPLRTVEEIRNAAGRHGWTRRQVDTLVELAARGLSRAEIGRFLRRPAKTVSSKLASLRRKGAL